LTARYIGKVLAYSPEANAGVIATADHQKYIFERRQWSLSRPPEAGESVTFVAHKNQAYEIRLFGVTQPSQSIFGLLKKAKDNAGS